ncbi:MAG: phosphoribosyltransferase [Blastocatellia bacterium]|nr:phosphoribosyltransferase [Blastocatellia bacterium]
MLYRDRTEAGKVLAEHLQRFANREDVVVLALPRGGVPVAAAVARALHAPLDVFVVRKLGLPGQEELAIGAIATGGVCILNDEVLRYLGLLPSTIERIECRERKELNRRELLYRDGRPVLDPQGCTVILVDDGLATGSTMLAAVKAVRQKNAARVIVAVPVGAAEACAQLGRVADECVCAAKPEPFIAVGRWYHDFTQTSDEEVRSLLQHAYIHRPAAVHALEERHHL